MSARTPIRESSARAQSGFMLLEALIGLLIFSIGILSVIGLQALSIRSVSDAKYRADAALLADELIGNVWTNGKQLADLQGKFNSPDGSEYVKWFANVQSALPGVSAANSTLPTVEVAPMVLDTGPTVIQVTVTVRWLLSGETAHSYSTLTQINCTVTDAAGTACSY